LNTEDNTEDDLIKLKNNLKIKFELYLMNNSKKVMKEAE